MQSKRIKQILSLLVVCLILFSCGIGPIYSPKISAEDSGLSLGDKSVVVSKFYMATTELTYTGSIDIQRILESAKLNDVSFNVANYLNSNNIRATAMKDADVSSLKDGELLLTGTIISRSIPMEENFPFPGMMIVILIGNILPSPAAYVSGVDLMFRYELIDSSGRILFSSADKDSRIYYKDYYIWGRIFNYKKYEQWITEKLESEIYDLIIEDLFK